MVNGKLIPIFLLIKNHLYDETNNCNPKNNIAKKIKKILAWIKDLNASFISTSLIAILIKKIVINTLIKNLEKLVIFNYLIFEVNDLTAITFKFKRNIDVIR